MQRLFFRIVFLTSLLCAASSRKNCQLVNDKLIEKMPELWVPQRPDTTKPKEFLAEQRALREQESATQDRDTVSAQKLAKIKEELVANGLIEGIHFKTVKDEKKGFESVIVFLPIKEETEVDEKWARLYRYVNYNTRRLKTGIVYSPYLMSLMAPNATAAFSTLGGRAMILVSDNLISQGPWSAEFHETMHAFAWQLRNAKQDSIFHGAILSGEVFSEIGSYKRADLSELIAYPHGQRFDLERINPRTILPRGELIEILTTIINHNFYSQFLSYDAANYSLLAAKNLEAFPNFELFIPEGKELKFSLMRNKLRLSKDKYGAVKVDVYFDEEKINPFQRKGFSAEFLNIEEIFDTANNPTLPTNTRLDALQKIILLARKRAQDVNKVATTANYFATQMMTYMKGINRDTVDQTTVYQDLREILRDILQVTTKNLVTP